MGVFTSNRLTLRRFRWPLLVMASAITVTVICKLDSTRQQTNETALALRWARQMATQAETLSLSASERREADPLAWAARILSQGTDSRIIFAQKFKPEDFAAVSNQSTENYEFDAVSGIFDYTKVLFPEDSAGIRIKLYVARTGIFGAKTLFTQDLTIAILFGLLFSLFFFITKKSEISEIIEIETAANAAPTPPPFVEQTEAVSPAISTEWIGGFKHALIELAKDIREITRSAHKISSSARLAKQEIATIKTKLEGNAGVAFDAGEMANLAKEAQILFATADPKTKTLLRKLLQVSVQKAAETDRLKKKMEEIASASDSASDALADVSDELRSGSPFGESLRHLTRTFTKR